MIAPSYFTDLVQRAQLSSDSDFIVNIAIAKPGLPQGLSDFYRDFIKSQEEVQAALSQNKRILVKQKLSQTKGQAKILDQDPR